MVRARHDATLRRHYVPPTCAPACDFLALRRPPPTPGRARPTVAFGGPIPPPPRCPAPASEAALSSDGQNDAAAAGFAVALPRGLGRGAGAFRRRSRRPHRASPMPALDALPIHGGRVMPRAPSGPTSPRCEPRPPGLLRRRRPGRSAAEALIFSAPRGAARGKKRRGPGLFRCVAFHENQQVPALSSCWSRSPGRSAYPIRWTSCDVDPHETADRMPGAECRKATVCPPCRL